LDIEPSEIFLVGIQPEKIELTEELSETVFNRIDRILEVIFMKLAEWNVQCEVRN
jgi:hypothetical protein